MEYTINHLSGIAGVSGQTIRNKVNQYFPHILKKGKKTILTEQQAKRILTDFLNPQPIPPADQTEQEKENDKNTEYADLDVIARNLYKKLKVELEQKGKWNEGTKTALHSMCTGFSIYRKALKELNKHDSIIQTIQTKAGAEYQQARPELSIIRNFMKETRDFCKYFGFSLSVLQDDDYIDGMDLLD